MGQGGQLHLKGALRHHLVMTQSLRQSIEVLEMPQQELAQWLREEIEKNPLLELNSPSSTKDCSLEISNLKAPFSLDVHLMEQIRETFPLHNDRQIAEKILEELDERGFISTPIEQIAAHLNKPLEKIEEIMHRLQTLDPPGIFARDLQENLLLQLKAKNQTDTFAYKIISKAFHDLLSGKFKKIKEKIGDLELKKALHTISKLNFRPRALFVEEKTPLVKSDLSILKINNTWVINTVEDEWPKFQFHEEYLSLKHISPEEKENLRNWASSARSIFRSLTRRQKLLIDIGDFLVRKQKDFLDEKGELKTVTIQDLAEHLGLHESTLSRALAGKYATTPRGFLPLRSLFCAAPNAQTAKHLLQQLVKEEDKNNPMTDEQLMNALKEVGLNLARRTIVKYRNQMKISVAARRRYH